jgi:hypothetical protein
MEELPRCMALSENVYQTTNVRKLAGVGIAWFVATIVAAAVGNVVTDVPTAVGIAAIRAMETERDALDIDGDDASALESATTSTLVPTAESEIPRQSSTTTAVAVTTTTQQVETSRTRTETEEAAGSSRQAETTSRLPAQPKTSTPTTTKPPTAGGATPTTTAPPTTTTPSPNAYMKEIATDGGLFWVRVEGDAVLFGSVTTYTTTDTVWRFNLLNGGQKWLTYS